MNQPELLTEMYVKDDLREAERLHQVSIVLQDRKAARDALFSMNLAQFWQGSWRELEAGDPGGTRLPDDAEPEGDCLPRRWQARFHAIAVITHTKAKSRSIG